MSGRQKYERKGKKIMIHKDTIEMEATFFIAFIAPRVEMVGVEERESRSNAKIGSSSRGLVSLLSTVSPDTMIEGLVPS